MNETEYPITRCHGCNEIIPNDQPSFCGCWYTPANTNKFGCAPHQYYCSKCCANSFKMGSENNLRLI